MGQSGSFPMGVLAEVARYLAADKDTTNVHTKYQAVRCNTYSQPCTDTLYWQLKKRYRAIEAYSNSSGRGQWSVTHGANISDMPEDSLAWEQFILTSVDVCSPICPTQAVSSHLLTSILEQGVGQSLQHRMAVLFEDGSTII